jgi:hypothetical protein
VNRQRRSRLCRFGGNYGPETIETVSVELYVVAYAQLGTASVRALPPPPRVPGVNVYVPMPLLSAAEATFTAVPLSRAVSEAILTEGALARPEQSVPVLHATVSGAMSSELVGRVSPPDGHAPVPEVHVNCDAWKVTFQPCPVPVVSAPVYEARVVATVWSDPFNVTANEPGVAPLTDRPEPAETATEVAPPDDANTALVRVATNATARIAGTNFRNFKMYLSSPRISSPCLWATTKYENGGPVKVVILWNYESVN